MEHWRTSVDLPRKRPVRVMASWGMHGTDQSMEMREALRSHCDDHSECSFIDLEGQRDSTNTEVVLAAMLNSTFCLQVTGDTPSRNGYHRLHRGRLRSRALLPSSEGAVALACD
eukprot:SRR837773.17844.p1 GENE.SRR837773.17844~~SRR837773.17844.p1  ORF type:complete len:124 (+),score=2.65 SRR837773.17844:32-373(+)